MERPIRFTLAVPSNRGWGNGYVAVPPKNPFHNVSADEIISMLPTHVEEITFAGSAEYYVNAGIVEPAYKDWWVFGFDTNHLNDNKSIQNAHFVAEATELLHEAVVKYQRPPLTRDEAVDRFVMACKEFDKENAKSVFNLNSVISLWNSAQSETGSDQRKEEILAQYRDIPESVINSVKGLIAHTKRLQNILFKGTDGDRQDFEEYKAEKQKFWDDLNNILKDFK